MVLTFPHLGNAYLAAKALCDGLKIDYVVPPMNSAEALRLGAMCSPEEICLPFKINMGNYLQSMEMGADTVVLTGSCGPCRFGEYCQLQAELMRSMGRDIEFIVIDKPSDIGFPELLKRIDRIACHSPHGRIGRYRALRNALAVVRRADRLDAKAHMLAGYEARPGECKRLKHECHAEAARRETPEAMLKTLRAYGRALDRVELDFDKKPVKIAVIGEIYTIIEPFANLYIEDRLMDLGVSTRRRLSPSWWMGHLAGAALKLWPSGLQRAARPYLAQGIGGHAVECVGEAVRAQEAGFDGAIQVFPVGCMPEIVSKSILPRIAKERDFPIMSLTVDEMTGEAGYATRLEAFVDMLERRRSKNVSGR
jgi:predicted nucleotide-binding protein (sugar kinase/HSP70/actin superfamily)